MSTEAPDVINAPPEARAAAIEALDSAINEPDPAPTTVVDDEAVPAVVEDAAAEQDSAASEAAPPAPTPSALKVKLRAQQARARQELENQRAEVARLKAEAEQDRQEAARQREHYARLERLRVEDPQAWINETGVDLVAQARRHLQQIDPSKKTERELAELREWQRQQVENERKAREEQQQRAQYQQQEATEREFLGVAANAEFRYLSKLAKANPFMAVQNAYIVSADYQDRYGRQPTMTQLAKEVERQLAEAYAERAEAAEQTQPGRRPGLTPAQAADANSVTQKTPSQMTEDERRRAAIRSLEALKF